MSASPSFRRMYQAFNVLAKWRSWFAGWQLGTHGEEHGPTRAVRDHREATMILRAEVSAITKLLVEKGVVTDDELNEAMAVEAEALSKLYSERFPGVEATEQGLAMDLSRARETMRREGFPP